jgi:pimeloyl-ACP methyl ester carboxylesterase
MLSVASAAADAGRWTMSISPQLGETREANLGQGTIRYRERGSGEPIVFVHGLLVNGDLWRKVVPPLSKDFRCITPDWPLGSHEQAMRADADLSPPGVAALIADFLAALDLEKVTLVGNDTGGAFCQLVVTEHPERIGRLVLTPCDAYENFPPRFFKYLLAPAALPGGARALLQPMRLKAARNSPIGFGWLSKRGIDPEISHQYMRPALSDAAIRRDLGKVMNGVNPKYTQDAAAKLAGFDRPVLIVWAPEKDFFPWEHAERLARTFPDARLERMDDSYTFVSEDQPERLAELIAAFVREPAREAAV